MAEPEDIDKLLREIDAMSQPRGLQPAQPASPPATPTSNAGGGRAAWTGVGAAGGLVVGGLAGALMPFVGAFEAGFGAAIGGAVVAFLSRPPEWFDKR